MLIERKELNKDIQKEAMRWVKENEGYKIESKSFYESPRISSEVVDCSMPLTFDHLNFCSYGCIFCFSYFQKSNNPMVTDLSLETVNVKRMIKILEGKPNDKRSLAVFNHFYSKKFLLHWGGLADPFCNFEGTNRVGLPLLGALGRLNYPTLFSTKGVLPLTRRPYHDLFERYAHQKNFAFQVSMVTFSDKQSQEIEIGVPPPSLRLKMIKELSDMGYYCILRLRPFIIGMTDDSINELLDAALKAGIKAVSMEFFALDARANEGMKLRYKWLGNQMGLTNLMEYFSVLSPSERGGYRRLNRDIKEEWVKRVYSFCVKNNLVFGCSDPDFKELCTSGSCCAMPDHYPENPLLENWTHNQMTYHLKEARKKYHLMGEKVRLCFDKVYTEKATYLDEPIFRDDHVAVIGMETQQRKAVTIRKTLLYRWQNLDSPANPFRYFDGKVRPVGLDEKGQLIYEYCPSPYEEDWKKEGINLTK